MSLIPARVGLQQRVLPEYRAPFFDALASACLRGLSVFAGDPLPTEAIDTTAKLTVAHRAQAINIHLFSGRAYLCWQANFLVWLRRWQPEVLIVEANPRYLATPLAMSLMRARRCPVIGWGLGVPSARGPGSAYRSWFLKQFDAVIAYSSMGAQQYIQAGLPTNRVYVAANAVASRPATLPVERPSEYQNNTPVLLFVGRLQERKRVDVLLRACAVLPNEIQPRLVVIGDGPDRSRLEQLAWQVYPKAVFTGAKFGKELDSYFDQADLFILPGTGGLAVQQAMAHALPVIVGAGDGTQSELVQPGNGWLLPDTTVTTLARTLQSALSDLPRLRCMGMESYRLVAEDVNIEAMVIAFGRAIRSVLR